MIYELRLDQTLHLINLAHVTDIVQYPGPAGSGQVDGQIHLMGREKPIGFRLTSAEAGRLVEAWHHTVAERTG